MKKILLFFVIALLAVFAITAEESEVPFTVLINETSDNYSIAIEYTEMLSEARFIYSCDSRIFDERDAIKIVRERLINFMKEKGYFHYSYLRPTITKTDYANHKTYFYSFVLLKQ